MHVGQPLFRGLRALVFAVACAVVSTGLHVFAGGAPAGMGPFAAAVAALVPVGLLFGGTRRGPAALLALCGAAQSGLHIWFSAGSGHPHHLVPGPAMLLVHLLAAMVSAVWLARGDAALAAFIDAVVVLLAAVVWPPLPWAAAPDAPGRVDRCSSPAAIPAIEPLVTAAAERGPPRRLLFQ